MSTAPAPAAAPSPAPPPPTVTPRWRRLLSGLEPVSTVFSPVFHREMRSTSRAAATFWSRTGVTLLLLVVASLVYIAAMDQAGRSGSLGIARLESLQRIAPTIFYPLAWILFVIVSMSAVNLTAPAINRERQRRTFATLATSPLTAGQIIFGTLAARLTQVLILTLLAVPLLLALRVFGGLEIETILGVAALTITTGVLGASLGILGSVLFKRPNAANSFGVGSLVFLSLLPILAAAIWVRVLHISTQPPLWPAVISPAFNLFFITSPINPTGLSNQQVVLVGCALNLGLSLGLGILASWLVRPLVLREAVSDGPAPAPSRRARRRKAAAAAAAAAPASGSEERSSISRVVGDNPVLWRELRTGRARRGLLALASLALAVIILVSVNIGSGFGSAEAVGISTMTLLLWFLFSASTSTTGSVTGEIETRSWSVLLTTPLSPQAILTAKVLGGLRKMWAIPLLILVVQGLGLIRGSTHPLLPVITLFVVAGAGVFLATTGVFWSLRCARTARANSLNLLTAVSLWLGLLMLVGLVGFMLGSRREPWYLGSVLLINPVGLVGMSFDACLSERLAGRAVEIPGLGRVSVEAYSLIAAGYTLLNLVLARVMIAWSAAKWDTLSVRRIG